MNVLIAGQMASGKSSVKEHLQKQGFTGVSLAAPMKHLEQEMRHGMNVRHSAEKLVSQFNDICYIYGWMPLTEKQMTEFMVICRYVAEMPVEDSPKQRFRLQYLGTEVRRRVSDRFWIMLMFDTVMRIPDRECILDDVRFLNELEFFVERGWLPIGLKVSPKVQRQRLITRDGGFNEAAFGHASETEVNQILKHPKVNLVNADLPLDEMLAEIDKIIRETNNA